MFNVITERQKNVITELSGETLDAVIAYGADLYRQGLIKGAIIASISATFGCLISAKIILAKQKKYCNDLKD